MEEEKSQTPGDYAGERSSSRLGRHAAAGRRDVQLNSEAQVEATRAYGVKKHHNPSVAGSVRRDDFP